MNELFIVFDGCKLLSSALVYVVIESLYRCINAILYAGKPSYSYFSWHIQSVCRFFTQSVLILSWFGHSIPSFMYYVWEFLLLFHFWETVWCRPLQLESLSLLCLRLFLLVLWQGPSTWLCSRFFRFQYVARWELIIDKRVEFLFFVNYHYFWPGSSNLLVS